MSKTELQAEELDLVSGGRRRPRSGPSPCTSCGSLYEEGVRYPVGFLLKEEKDGCSWVYTYKCPNCGYEWC